MVIFMNYLKLHYKSNLKYIKIFLFFFSLGLILGLFYYYIIDSTLIITKFKSLPDLISNNHLNFIFNDILIVSLLFTSTFSGLGLIITSLYILFLGITSMLIILLFASIWSFKGLFYSLTYLLLTRFIYYLFLIYFLKFVFNITKELLILVKDTSNFNPFNIKANLKRFTIILTLIILNDLIVYFFSSKILEKLTFILK